MGHEHLAVFTNRLTAGTGRASLKAAMMRSHTKAFRKTSLAIVWLAVTLLWPLQASSAVMVGHGNMASCRFMPGMERGHSGLSMQACHRLQCQRHMGPTGKVAAHLNIPAAFVTSIPFPLAAPQTHFRVVFRARPRSPPLYTRYSRLLI
ncbi:MAG: hypothetical protein ACYDEV_03055 [Acidiferrobacter sp.]